MTYPQFFNNIPTIKLQDDLASLLGAFEDGLIEYSYLDSVKSAGHSCPTVLGAYLMTLEGLKALYENEIPSKMWTLNVSELLMLGRKTIPKLSNMRIRTIGDLAKTDKELLSKNK